MYQAVITSGSNSKTLKLTALDDAAKARINRAADDFYSSGGAVQIVLNKVVDGVVVSSKVL